MTIMPPYLFEEHKPRIAVKFPFCELNEKRVSIHLEKNLIILPMTVMI